MLHIYDMGRALHTLIRSPVYMHCTYMHTCMCTHTHVFFRFFYSFICLCIYLFTPIYLFIDIDIDIHFQSNGLNITHLIFHGSRFWCTLNDYLRTSSFNVATFESPRTVREEKQTRRVRCNICFSCIFFLRSARLQQCRFTFL